jgi:hypothetical protein
MNDWRRRGNGKRGFISIDEKTIRGSGNAEHPPVHMVSAWAGEEEIVLGQVAVDESET